jgi:hypothetical protein
LGDSKIIAEPRRGGAVPAVILAWLLPGLGHLYLRRTTKGLVLLTTILTLFSLGVAWDARLAPYLRLDDLLAFLRSIAQMAMGLPYFIARSLGFDAGLVTAPSHEYGNTFTEVSGLLNILVMLDAYDIAVGRKSGS